MDIANCVLVMFLFSLYVSVADSNGNVVHMCFAEDDTTWRCNYIPNTIPGDFSRVRIVDIVKRDHDMICDNTSFSTTNNSVIYIEFADEDDQPGHFVFENTCLQNLKNLQEIRIHSQAKFTLFGDVFVGIPKVEILDFSRCSRLPMGTLMKAMKGRDKLRSLKVLKLAGTGSIMPPYEINNQFMTALPRYIVSLEMSKMQLSYFNFTALLFDLTHLKSLNLSYSNINDFSTDSITTNSLKNLDVLDLSYAGLPKYNIQTVGNVMLRNAIFQTNISKMDNVNVLLTAKTVNISGLLDSTSSTYRFNNLTLILSSYVKWQSKHVILHQNSLKRLDIKWMCKKHKLYSVQQFDISNNGLEYIHPSMFMCMPNIESIGLSHNSLFEMVRENISMFANLFTESSKLKYIDLSENTLTSLPYRTFEQNQLLEIINLSGNKLEQIDIFLPNLEHLRVLDLSNNRIKVLDEVSLSNVNLIPTINTGNISTTKESTVVLSFNPISCSTCDSSQFVKWLTESRFVDIKSQNLTCLNEKKIKEPVTLSTLDHVRSICHRKAIIIATCVTIGVIAMATAVIITLKIRHKKRELRALKKARIIANLRQGVGQFEFLAMLSYSNDDEDFCIENIKTPMNKTLKEIIGVDRNLILTGDEHFRPGFMVHNEISTSLERVSVVLLLVTESFCTSNYCLSELDQAYILKKPIILMFKDEVDENKMCPTLRTLYKDNARVLWKVENGIYKLKTTWDNVCNSILDLMLG